MPHPIVFTRRIGSLYPENIFSEPMFKLSNVILAQLLWKYSLSFNQKKISLVLVRLPVAS